MSGFDVVTGAFGYTGKYIAARLLSDGRIVRTITGHTQRENPFGDRVRVCSFNFHRPERLARDLQGADTLYNTYWVRFEHGSITYDKAVENSKILFQAAAKAGVKKIVHISIANPDADGARQLPYYKGKAVLEEAVKTSGMSYAIIRPTVIFSREDILINNIAWLLKHLPFFAVPGAGNYRIQPVFIEDVANIAVDAGRCRDDRIIDAVGPEIYTFTELVELMAGAIKGISKDGKPKLTRVFHVPPFVALFCAKMVGLLVNDVVLTRDELAGLSANLLVSGQTPTGATSFRNWLVNNINFLGNEYASELNRHY